MSVGNSSNLQQDQNMVDRARNATAAPENKTQKETTHTHTSSQSQVNEGVAKLSKLVSGAAKGLMDACAASPEFAAAIADDPDYCDMIYEALQKNPKLFNSQENVQAIVASFKADMSSYSKYNAEMEKIGKEEAGKALMMHMRAIKGEFGTKAFTESLTALGAHFAGGKIGGIFKLAASLRLFEAKDVADMVPDSGVERHRAVLGLTDNAERVTDNEQENAGNQARLMADSGRGY